MPNPSVKLNPLTPEQEAVLWNKETEFPGTGKFLFNKDSGTYVCAACGTPLFSSDAKFDSGSGWPSFSDVIEQGNVELVPDDSHGMHRTEVVCKTCGGHLGHVFDYENGKKYYCINSCSLDFEKKDQDSDSTPSAK